jgi:pilus assembly protein Flp/PilA
MKAIMNFIREEEGATAVEYGLLVALIAAVIVAVVAVLGPQVCRGFRIVSVALAAITAIGGTPGDCPA